MVDDEDSTRDKRANTSPKPPGVGISPLFNAFMMSAAFHFAYFLRSAIYDDLKELVINSEHLTMNTLPDLRHTYL